MPRYSLSNLKEGMLPVGDILDKQGQVLIRAREKLTKNHFTLLELRGITAVEVLLTAETLRQHETLACYPKKLVDNVLLQAESRFKFYEDSQLLTHLFKFYFVKNSLTGANH